MENTSILLGFNKTTRILKINCLLELVCSERLCGGPFLPLWKKKVRMQVIPVE